MSQNQSTPSTSRRTTLSNAEKLTLKHLVQRTTRAFYSDNAAIAADLLVQLPIVKAEEAALRLKIQPKEFGKFIAKMLEDNLVQTEFKSEPRSFDQKQVPRTWYYIDYRKFINIVTFKLYKLTEKLKNQMSNEQVDQGFICPICGFIYSTLDVHRLINNQTGEVLCEHHRDVQPTELDEYTPKTLSKATSLLARLGQQIKPLQVLLEQVRRIRIPEFNAKEYIAAIQPASGASGQDDDGSLGRLSMASNQFGETGNMQISVDIVSADDPRANKSKQDKVFEERKKQREQNKLPMWQRVSTVTGIIPTEAELEKLQSQDKDSHDNSPKDEQEEDQVDEDFYAQYYKKLESQQSQNMQPVPPTNEQEGELTLDDESNPSKKRKRDEYVDSKFEGSENNVIVPMPPTKDDEDDDEDFDEDQFEDVQIGNFGSSNDPERLSTETPPESTPPPPPQEPKPVEPTPLQEDDTIVTVKGIKTSIYDITEKLQMEMTDEEYQHYVTMYEKYNAQAQ